LTSESTLAETAASNIVEALDLKSSERSSPFVIASMSSLTSISRSSFLSFLDSTGSSSPSSSPSLHLSVRVEPMIFEKESERSAFFIPLSWS